MGEERHDFSSHSVPVTTAKMLLSLNLGSLIRTALGGVTDGRASLEKTYEVVSPFAPLKHRKGQALYDRLPVVSLKTLVPVPERVTLDLRYLDVYGSTPYRDMIAIISLAVGQNPKSLVEIGTYFGSTTANLALNLPHAHIHTMDLPEEWVEGEQAADGPVVDDEHLIKGRQLGKCFRESELAGRITQHTGDTATYDYSRIDDNPTFFLIDGSHTYEYAKSDTLNSFRMGKGVCMFLLHDCDPYHPGVTGWLVEMLGAGLPVQRIENTSVGYLKVDTADPRVRAFLD